MRVRIPGLRGTAAAVAVLTAVAACDDPGTLPTGGESDDRTCIIDTDFLVSTGVSRGSIPSVSNPVFVDMASEPEPGYLEPDSRVLGLTVEGRAYAIPHNILWYHEIVNLDAGSRSLAVTLCPLTGSSLVFDRASIGGETLHVTGLLFQNNLVMFHTGDEGTIWPQMLGQAACGSSRGEELGRYPAVETTWAEWRELHPSTLVPAEDQGFSFPYDRNPYASYVTTDEYHYALSVTDSRRPPKERVVGAPPAGADPGMAFPFGELEAMAGERAVVAFPYRGEEAVLLWSDAARGGTAFRPRTGDGRAVSLAVQDGAVVDAETGSRWTVDGRAVSGSLSGARLEPVAAAYTAYWAAWVAFFPETRLWSR